MFHETITYYFVIFFTVSINSGAYDKLGMAAQVINAKKRMVRDLLEAQTSKRVFLAFRSTESLI